MRANILRSFAVILVLSGCTMASAQYSSVGDYAAPSKWSNFNAPVTGNVLTAAAGDDENLTDDAAEAAEADAEPEELPAPATAPEPIPAPESDAHHGVAEPQHAPMPHHPMPAPAGSGVMPYTPAPMAQPAPASSAYECAASAPWGGNCNVRPELSPYFGSANVLLFTMENDSNRYVASGLGTDFSTTLVDPEFSVGFDAMVGRYLNCGQYGLGIGYMLWDPGSESVVRTGTAGTIRASSPAYRDITIDAGAGAEDVYAIIDGSGAYTGAAGARIIRDVRFQGIEANLFSFGLMGARRVAFMNSASSGMMGTRFGKGNCKGYGGAVGPLQRAAGGRVRVMTGHGFRWFRADDDLELSYNIDGTAGYQANDLYENIDVTNNLYGYQFSGRLVYCLNCRLNLSIGGKIGIYGNDIRVRHRVGTLGSDAYLTATPTDFINSEASETALSSLGELDFGLGYRINCAWSVRGGYRLMGVTGVATAVDSLPTNYASLAAAHAIPANSSYLLHGGYVGLEYNW